MLFYLEFLHDTHLYYEFLSAEIFVYRTQQWSDAVHAVYLSITSQSGMVLSKKQGTCMENPCFRLTTGDLPIMCSLSYVLRLVLPLTARKQNQIWHECRRSRSEAKHVVHTDVDAVKVGIGDRMPDWKLWLWFMEVLIIHNCCWSQWECCHECIKWQA